MSVKALAGNKGDIEMGVLTAPATISVQDPQTEATTQKVERVQRNWWQKCCFGIRPRDPTEIVAHVLGVVSCGYGTYFAVKDEDQWEVAPGYVVGLGCFALGGVIHFLAVKRSLDQEAKEFKYNNNRLTQEISELNKEKKELEEANSELQAIVERLEEDINALQQSIQQLEKDLEEEKQLGAVQKKNLKELQSHIKEFQEAIKILVEKKHDDKQDDPSKEEIDELDERIKKLKEQYEKVKRGEVKPGFLNRVMGSATKK